MATMLISTGDASALSYDGWADVLSTGSVSGFAIFRWTAKNGWPLEGSEGTVALQDQYASAITIPYDNTTGFLMGVALANLSSSSVSVTATIRDDMGNPLGSQFIPLAGGGHISFVLPSQMPITVGKRGIVTFQSSATGGLAGLGLRFSSFGTLTSVPTM